VKTAAQKALAIGPGWPRVQTSQKPTVQINISATEPTAAVTDTAFGRTVRPPKNGNHRGTSSPTGRTRPNAVRATASDRTLMKAT
jgi:hypothetical protein